MAIIYLRKVTTMSSIEPRDRPDAEIEVTEEMIRAGADELDGLTVENLMDGFTTRHAVAESVYRAMLRASPAKQ